MVWLSVSKWRKSWTTPPEPNKHERAACAEAQTHKVPPSFFLLLSFTHAQQRNDNEAKPTKSSMARVLISFGLYYFQDKCRKEIEKKQKRKQKSVSHTGCYMSMIEKIKFLWRAQTSSSDVKKEWCVFPHVSSGIYLIIKIEEHNLQRVCICLNKANTFCISNRIKFPFIQVNYM